jgi:DNA modification methylase
MGTRPTKRLFDAEDVTPQTPRNTGKNGKRANDLSGSEWTRNSISVWADVRKSRFEEQLKHPAMFPEALANRLLQSLTTNQEKVVLDPFMGSGATLAAAHALGRRGVGFEIYPEHIEKTQIRFQQEQLALGQPMDIPEIIRADARRLTEYFKGPADICITSPPYWDILERKRTADYKEIRNYGEAQDDLGKISDYEEFLGQLDMVWMNVNEVLKPGGYMCIIVMDLRKQDRFYPYHMDIARHVTSLKAERPFELDDIIIWNRQAEYNNLRCLGYPYTFRVNKVHEFVLIFKKKKEH